MPESVAIGQLRWPVTIARRVQAPAADGVGVAETLRHVLATRARIDQLGATTYYGAAATDTPFTHKIWLRWLPWLDTRHVILRATEMPGGGYRSELFRVRRVGDWNGRKRFSYVEGEEERQIESELDPAGPSAPSPGAFDLADVSDPDAPLDPAAPYFPPPAAPALPLVFRFPTPQPVWVLPHGLGRIPDVSAFDASGERIYPDERGGERETVLTFNPPAAGVAYVE